jgi:uncharacterized DUF497 family protein
VKINGILWLEDIVEKIARKHNVRDYEIVEVLQENPYFRFVEKGYQRDEDLYAALGRTNSGRYMIIFFIYKTDKNALIVSARDMTKTERRKYERK